MGRTAVITENPAKYTLKWKNAKFETKLDEKGNVVKKDGKPLKEEVRPTGWYYWDKETEKEILVEMPIAFLWLETATSIAGYNKKLETGVYSNEVLDLKKQPLVVKIGQDIVAEGLYNTIKDEVKGQGGKYCSPVYGLADINGEENVVVRFLMVGSSNSAWITFNNAAKNRSHAIVCHGSEWKQTATGDDYEEPAFKYVAITNEEQSQAADAAYEEQVKPYFDYILEKKKEDVPVDGDYN